MAYVQSPASRMHLQKEVLLQVLLVDDSLMTCSAPLLRIAPMDYM